MPYNTDIIWVGTDIGLVESTDNGVSWHLANNGLPQVAIWEIRIVDDEVVDDEVVDDEVTGDSGSK